MSDRASHDMFNRLVSARDRTAAGKTLEVFGWVCLIEAVVVMMSPSFVASALHLPAFTEQGAAYFRLAALLVGGVGMLYVVSGRLGSEEFVFASLLDRPLVPPAMAVLWYLGVVPGPLALAFSIQDFSGFLWTLHAWRAQRATVAVAH